MVSVATGLVLATWLASTGPSAPPPTVESSTARPVSEFWRKLERLAQRQQSPVESIGLLRKHFAVFRSQPERMPRKLKAHVLVMFQPRLNAMQFALAQYAPWDEGGVWLVPSHSIVCIIQAGQGSGSCALGRTVARQGLAILARNDRRSVRGKPRYELVGVAPDDIKGMAITVGRERRVLPVSGNTYGLYARRLLLITGAIR